MTLEYPLFFLLSIPLIAALYSSVGHGGASGYLAIMALFSFDPVLMKPTALLLNLFVSGIAFYYFRKNGFFSWRLFFPFAMTSIPAAFAGGFIELNSSVYRLILGILLIISIPRLLGWFSHDSGEIKKAKLFHCMIAGLLIGLLSGLIGIGGGIILSPLILLFHWADMKETAAVSALFIFVNSLAGISGMLLRGWSAEPGIIILPLLALAGGIVGSFLGSTRISSDNLRKVLALVLAVAGLKLLFS